MIPRRARCSVFILDIPLLGYGPRGKESPDDPRVQAIAAAAKDLVEKRDRWVNPEGASEAELKKRTLTNLYNVRPTWLDPCAQAPRRRRPRRLRPSPRPCHQEILGRHLDLRDASPEDRA